MKDKELEAMRVCWNSIEKNLLNNNDHKAASRVIVWLDGRLEDSIPDSEKKIGFKK